MARSVIASPSFAELAFELKLVPLEHAPHGVIVDPSGRFDSVKLRILTEEPIYKPGHGGTTYASSAPFSGDAQIEHHASNVCILQIQCPDQPDWNGLVLNPKGPDFFTRPKRDLACLFDAQCGAPVERPAVLRQKIGCCMRIRDRINFRKTELKRI
jgi:hypothetical protein